MHDSTLVSKVGRYSEAVSVTCVTILQCTYRFGNQTAVLHCRLRRNLKETPDKNHKRTVRSGCTPKFIKTKRYAGR